MIEKRPAKLLPLPVTTVLRGIEQGQSFIFAIQNISDGHHVWVIRAQGCLLYSQRTLKEGPADMVTPLHQAHTPCPFSASDAAACTLAEQVLQPSHPERPCMLQFKPCASGLVATDVMCPILASCQSLCHSTPKYKDMLNTVACMHTGLLKGLQYHSPAPHAARPRYITVPDAQLAQKDQHQPGWLPCACCT